MSGRSVRIQLAVCVALLCSAARAGTIDADPSTYRVRLAGLAPGDTLRLARGVYSESLPLSGINGTAELPIVIEGPLDRSAVFQAQSCCNTVQFNGSSYIAVRNLTLDGMHRPEPFGVESSGPSHHITIENLEILNYDADQAMIGISTKAPAWEWTIRGNTIVGAGTGMYLGNSTGDAPFVAGIIEYNLIIYTLGYNIEIKHQNPRPSGVGLPSGDSRTIIRHNVFSKAKNASTGANARPNLLVGHFPLSGVGTNDRYEIYGNFFYENPTEALFQGEGNIVLHDNVFVNRAGSAINVQPHNDVPRTVLIYHNTVVASGDGIRVTGGAPGTTQRIVGNAVYARVPVMGPNAADNVTGAYLAAAAGLNSPTAALGALNLFPRSGALMGPAMDLSSFRDFVDGTKDFNGRPRTGAHRGAYEGDGMNPGWAVALEIKPAASDR
jgi:parallel beta helix pectate lyase-like protein